MKLKNFIEYVKNSDIVLEVSLNPCTWLKCDIKQLHPIDHKPSLKGYVINIAMIGLVIIIDNEE